MLLSWKHKNKTFNIIWPVKLLFKSILSNHIAHSDTGLFYFDVLRFICSYMRPFTLSNCGECGNFENEESVIIVQV